MKSVPFLTVDNQSISLKQAIRMSKAVGGFSRFLREILQQYILETELDLRLYIKVEELNIEQGIINFRLQNNLTDTNKFNQWLASNKWNYEDFKNRIIFGLKVEELKAEVTEAKLETYFQECKENLDQVVLSRIILNSAQLADSLRQQINEDSGRFATLAKEHSLTDDSTTNGKMAPMKMGNIPDILKTNLKLANPGDIIGPLALDGRYCLFRLEELIPASLEGEVKKELQNQLFAQWMQEKLQKLNVNLEV